MNNLNTYRFGLFWNMNEPCIFLKDLELIKKVQVTDYESFMDFGRFQYLIKYKYLEAFNIHDKIETRSDFLQY